MGVQIDRVRGKEMDQFLKAVLSLKNMDEAYAFFDDLCTINEVQAFAQRLEVGRMLAAKCTYQKIELETGASTATISRVKRAMQHGNGMYQLTLDRVLDPKRK